MDPALGLLLMNQELSVVVLAAGKGTRMRNGIAKVLHPLAGRPLIRHVLATAADLRPGRTVVVLAPSMDEVTAEVERSAPGAAVAIQDPPMGTGHALMAARAHLPAEGTVLVLYGDTPLITSATLERLVACQRDNAAAVAVLAATGLAFTPAIAGHAATQEPTAALVSANAVHVGAMAIWLGGLVCLLGALPAATRTLGRGSRAGILLAALTRFSTLALGAVIALSIAGVIQAVVELERVAELWSTGFGRLLIAKSVLLVTLAGLGWHNRDRLIPALAKRVGADEPPGDTGFGLRRNLRSEVALIGVAIGLSALLVSYAPPGTAAEAGPASGRAEVGQQVLEYAVDPAAVGRNQMHLYLFDSETGEQFDGAREIVASASRDGIGPIPVELRRAGPGHWVAPALLLGAPGEWRIEVSVRTSRFDQHTVELEVEVR